MSYVLDALRRADAQRHSGTVPTLHAQAPPPPAAEPDTAPRRWWPWVAALALLAAAGIAAWLWTRSLPAPAQPAAAPTDAERPRPADRATVAPLPVPPMPVPRRPPPVVAEPAAPPPAADDKPVPLAQLPEALRRELPAMAFGGATDSRVAASRMLIVNGQLHREGEEIAPGLVLERIALRSALMRFKGRRFEVSY